MEIDLAIAPIVGKSYGPFVFGDAMESVARLIDFPIQNAKLQERAEFSGWSYKRNTLGMGFCSYESLCLGGSALELVFKDEVLTEIILGEGWCGSIFGVSIGDPLTNEIGDFSVVFNDQQDEFLLKGDGGFIDGVSIGTNARASLDALPDQVILKLRLFDLS